MAKVDWVDYGLERWADHCRDGRDNGLGYPSCSVEAREFSGGGVNASPDPYVPPVVALMESAVLDMDKDMQDVVMVAYMSSNNREYQANKLSGKWKKKITRPRLTELITSVHSFIDGYGRAVDPLLVMRLKKMLT